MIIKKNYEADVTRVNPARVDVIILLYSMTSQRKKELWVVCGLWRSSGVMSLVET